jgi:hypothetical protein
MEVKVTKRTVTLRMRAMRACIVVGSLCELCACASSGVIPVGDGVLMLTKKGAGGMLTTGDELLADLYQEANTYCTSNGGKVQTVDTETANAIPFVHMPYAKLRFRCAS